MILLVIGVPTSSMLSLVGEDNPTNEFGEAREIIAISASVGHLPFFTTIRTGRYRAIEIYRAIVIVRRRSLS